MLLTDKVNGNCLCGACQVVAASVNMNVGACHCDMCRKWSGGPFLSVNCGSKVSFVSAGAISVFDSSEWAERGFCKQCGTHLYYRLKPNNHYYVPIGLFNTPENVVFDHQIFIDSKPCYYAFANETKKLTGAEVFAQFADGSE